MHKSILASNMIADQNSRDRIKKKFIFLLPQLFFPNMYRIFFFNISYFFSRDTNIDVIYFSRVREECARKSCRFNFPRGINLGASRFPPPPPPTQIARVKHTRNLPGAYFYPIAVCPFEWRAKCKDRGRLSVIGSVH